MANEDNGHPRRPRSVTDPVMRSVRVWNELLAASTDMAFDLVLKNWDYSRSLRGSAEQAIADALRLQRQLSKEMLQAWDGYSSEIIDILDRGGTGMGKRSNNPSPA